MKTALFFVSVHRQTLPVFSDGRRPITSICVEDCFDVAKRRHSASWATSLGCLRLWQSTASTSSQQSALVHELRPGRSNYVITPPAIEPGNPVQMVQGLFDRHPIGPLDDQPVHDRLVDFKNWSLKALKTRLGYLILIERKTPEGR